MALDNTLAAALGESHLRTFFAVRIELINGLLLNLIDGSGFVTFDVDGESTTFTDSALAFGQIASISSIEEKIASEAPTVSISFMSHSDEAVGDINNPTNQGSPVRIWWGIVNEMTGAVLGVPELLWSGRLDTVNTKLADKSQIVEIETVSAFDRLFIASEGECLNKVWHQLNWPGETGLNFNVESTVDPFWGGEAPKPSSTPVSGGSSGGGSGWSGGGGYGGSYRGAWR